MHERRGCTLVFWHENVAPSRAILLHTLQLSFEKAGDFLDNECPGIEDTFSLGAKLCVGIRGDGNCFFSATTVGALLAALCQDDTRMLEVIVERFRKAVFRGTNRVSWGELPSNIEVRDYTAVIYTLLLPAADRVQSCKSSVSVSSRNVRRQSAALDSLLPFSWKTKDRCVRKAGRHQ